MHLNNGDEQNIQLGKVNYIENSDYNLFIPQCMRRAINELWLVAATATCIVIVTIVETHRLIIDVCVSEYILLKVFWSEQFLLNVLCHKDNTEYHML